MGLIKVNEKGRDSTNALTIINIYTHTTRVSNHVRWLLVDIENQISSNIIVIGDLNTYCHRHINWTENQQRIIGWRYSGEPREGPPLWRRNGDICPVPIHHSRNHGLEEPRCPVQSTPPRD